MGRVQSIPATPRWRHAVEPFVQIEVLVVAASELCSCQALATSVPQRAHKRLTKLAAVELAAAIQRKNSPTTAKFCARIVPKMTNWKAPRARPRRAQVLHGEPKWSSEGWSANQCQCRPEFCHTHAPRSVCRTDLEAQNATHHVQPKRNSEPLGASQIPWPDGACHPKRIIEATTADAGPFRSFQGLMRSLSLPEAAGKVFVIHSAGTQRSTHAHSHTRIADVAPRLPGSVPASSSMR